MKGSIEQRGETSYRIRVYVGKDPATGKKLYHQETVNGPTRAKAEAAAHARRAEILKEVNQGTWVSPDRGTFGEYLKKKFLPFKLPPRVRQSTYDQYEYICRVHIIPALGLIPLQKISPIMLDSFYMELAKKDKARSGKGKLSLVTIKRIHDVINISLRQAVKWRLIGANAAEAATPLEPEGAEPNVWTAEETAAFLSGAKDDPYYAAYMLFVTAALRRGECAGLEWPRVLYELGGVDIQQAVTHTSKGNVVQEPKTKKSKGLVACSPATMDALQDRRIVQLRERRAFEAKHGPGTYFESNRVFTYPDGRPVSPQFLSVHFKKLSEDLGLRPIRLHDLRKTGATLYYKVTKDLRQTKEHLRHAKIETTDQVYVAEIPEFALAAVRQMDEILKLGGAKSTGCPKDVQEDVQ